MNGLSLSIIHSQEKHDRRERLILNGVHVNSNKYNDVDKDAIFRRDNYKCVYCDFSGFLTLDHLIPRSFRFDYGMPYYIYNSPSNIVSACRYCNEDKSNLPLEHFLDDHEEFKPRFYSRTLYVSDKIFHALGLLEQRKIFLEQHYSKLRKPVNGIGKIDLITKIEDLELELFH